METWRIIGVDCAVDSKRVGVAVGTLDGDRLLVSEAVQCRSISVVDAVTNYAVNAERVLIALDAPLGWPMALGRALAMHRAGAPIEALGHGLFRRRTDVVVKSETGQQPLDVGADRIARTAVAALALLAEIRARLSAEIPLAWSIPAHDGVFAIEVYPAATLRQLGIEPRAYKEAAHVENRMRIFDDLSTVGDLSRVHGVAESHADAFDAMLCVIAGADFLRGGCRSPHESERATAEHEGWIWFRMT